MPYQRVLAISLLGLGACGNVSGHVSATKTGRVKALKEPYLRGPSPRVKEALDALSAALR